MQAFAPADPGGAFDRFMHATGSPGYPAVLTSQLGPRSLEAAQTESAGRFFFADELPAVQEWVFGPCQAARVTQPALVVLGGDTARHSPVMTETVHRLPAMLPRPHPDPVRQEPPDAAAAADRARPLITRKGSRWDRLEHALHLVSNSWSGSNTG